jgi:hypothetical protein
MLLQAKNCAASTAHSIVESNRAAPLRLQNATGAAPFTVMPLHDPKRTAVLFFSSYQHHRRAAALHAPSRPAAAAHHMIGLA